MGKKVLCIKHNYNVMCFCFEKCFFTYKENTRNIIDALYLYFFIFIMGIVVNVKLGKNSAHYDIVVAFIGTRLVNVIIPIA